MPFLSSITGAMSVCDKGTAFTPLVATGGGRVQLCGATAAVVTDVVPGVNLLPFGMCTVTTSLCSPVPVGSWLNPIPSCVIGNVESLLEGATLPCGLGGVIRVVSAAQAKLTVDVNRRIVEKQLGAELVIEDLLALGVPLEEILGGAAVHVTDGGRYAERWAGIAGAFSGKSSHPWSDQTRLRRDDGSGILWGTDKNGDTWVQLEKTNMPASVGDVDVRVGPRGIPSVSVSVDGTSLKEAAEHVVVDYGTYKADDLWDADSGILPDADEFVTIDSVDPRDWDLHFGSGDAPNRGPEGTSEHNDNNPIVVDDD